MQYQYNQQQQQYNQQLNQQQFNQQQLQISENTSYIALSPTINKPLINNNNNNNNNLSKSITNSRSINKSSKIMNTYNNNQNPLIFDS